MDGAASRLNRHALIGAGGAATGLLSAPASAR
jgi:hypothetical protein